MKNIGLIAALFVCVSIAAHHYSLPITFLDLFLNSVSICLAYGLYAGRGNYEEYLDKGSILKLTRSKVVGIYILFICLLLMFIGITYIGVKDPLSINKSLKGIAYGYTAGTLGIIGSIYLLIGMYLLGKTWKKA